MWKRILGLSIGTTSQDPAERIVQHAEFSLYRILFWGMLIGFGCIAGYSWLYCSFYGHLLTVSILMALALFVSGFFLGNLFGMPKRNKEEGQDYTLNNSLVEIADWLTKIIVGLGLVQLRMIPHYLKQIGDYFAAEAGTTNTPDFIHVYAIVLVVYFGVLGTYLGYNYMRLVLSQKYKTADDNLMEKLARDNEALRSALRDNDKTEWYTYEAAKKLIDNNGRGVEEQNAKLETLERIWTKANEIYKAAKPGSNDPENGLWGGKAEANGFRLGGRVEEKSQGLYELTLTVQCTVAAGQLSDGDLVLFALHDTYGNPPFRFVLAEHGTAVMKVFSYGSFTVGALLISNNLPVTLELNLAELPGVSEYFKTH